MFAGWWWAVGCAGGGGADSGSEEARTCTADDVPQVSVTEPPCAGTDVPPNLYTVLVLEDEAGSPCTDGVCAGDRVNVLLEVRNPCPASVDLHLGCPAVESYTLKGPYPGFAPESYVDVPCETKVLSVAPLEGSGTFLLPGVSIADLAPGLYDLHVESRVSASADATFCLQP